MRKVLVVLGPTAVGKTEFVQKLVPYVGQVLLADTACFYQDLHIGTAKPSVAELQACPHAFVNTLQLQQSYDVGQFYHQADILCQQNYQDQRVPLLTGGSLFYITNFLYGLSLAPSTTAATRQYWQQQLQEHGEDALWQQLQHIDAITAARVHKHDHYRITRALEVWTDTGKPLSHFARPQQLRADYDWFIIRLQRPRHELYQRINQRVEVMWQQGLPQEVATLQQQGVLASWPAMQAIGYRQFFMQLGSEIEIKEKIKQDTRHYAKRQETFLKEIPAHVTAHPDQADEIVQMIQAWLKQPETNKGG